MKNDKNLYQTKDKNSNNAGWSLILFATVLLALFLYFAYQMADIRDKHTIMQSMTLCEVTEPCTIQTTVTFDNEPIEIQLITPSGKHYAEAEFNTYEITDNKIICTVNTDEIGEWKVEYNNLTNTDVKITYDLLPPNQLYFENVKINNDAKNFTVSLKTIYQDQSDKNTKVNCLIRMSSDTKNKSVAIYDAEIPINQELTLECNTSNLVTGTNWQFSIQTYSVIGETDPFACKYKTILDFTQIEETDTTIIENNTTTDGPIADVEI